MHPILSASWHQWPTPYDEAAASRLQERFNALDSPHDGPGCAPGAAQGDLRQPDGQALLRCLGGNSPFLSALAVREAATLRAVWAQGADTVFAQAMARLEQTSPLAKRADVAAALRQAKREAALIIAIADIGAVWPLETVTGALSQLAECALRVALRHLLRQAHASREIVLADPENAEEASGFVVLGMGKLGAGELNYSSDIDLILIYDGEAPTLTSGRAADRIGTFTARLARDLVGLMETRDANGYVFRTDLRLRPDPAAMPPAVSLHSALTYYESMGQNWERTAMIKARPVAGDLALGHRFLNAIRPFVWRRGLDFAAVADIHAMKRRINVAKNLVLNPSASPSGFNVKLGPGGIREIEFIVQTQQVVWGGRDPAMRLQATLPALRHLAEAGYLQQAAASRLAEAYRFLRQVEHRLQMINDRQTHTLPESEDELSHVARFLGYPDRAALTHNLCWHLRQVRSQYQAVFEHVPDPPTEAEASVLELTDGNADPAASLATLRRFGFTDAERVLSIMREWSAGRVRALRSSRARELMTTVLPSVLQEIGKQPNPDEAFGRFDRLIGALPAGVQPMSLFQHNPALVERLAAVLGAAPRLSEHLARHPVALEALVAPGDLGDPGAAISSRLVDAVRLEDVIQIVRRTVTEQDFMLSVAELEGRLDVDEAGLRRTALAEAALDALIPRVLADFAMRFGQVPGGGLAVVAMGKAGGREMMPGSDLDLMFIYDHPAESLTSTGARELPASQWFVRAVQACIAAITAPGAEGPMYLLDMRLRPSGNKGPLAVSLRSFRRYHEQDAWTWERMALTRARVVTGPPQLREQVTAAISAAISRAGGGGRVRADAADMRRRMLRDLPPHGVWDMKLRAGGLVEVEFVAQALQLVHAGAPWFACSPTTRIALRRLAENGVIAEHDATCLMQAERVWRAIQGILRLTVGQPQTAALPDTTAVLVLRRVAAAGLAADDIEALLRRCAELGAQVRALFENLVGPVQEGA